jgi:hypothetical protein
MQLNDKQQYAMTQVITGNNLFIDGPGGVGKSVLVREIQGKFSDSTVFLAPTGIAALNIDGATVHSTFRFGFGVLGKRDHRSISDSTRDLFDKETSPVKRIVIDEISMVRADLLVAIDQQLRLIRRLNQPFGGLQVIVVGDFYQLPPVLTPRDLQVYNREGFESPFCFSTDTWAAADIVHVELDQVMRQSDEVMIDNLMKIRKKAPGWQKSVDFFNSIGNSNKEEVLDEDPIFLCATNKSAQMINEINYSDLEGEELVSHANKTGKFTSEPAPNELKLRYGTKVLLTANTDVHKNGQVGYVVGFVGDKIQVLLEDTEEQILVEKFKWEEIEYGVSDAGVISRNPIGTYKQYPMKHGWGITIHKSQGQSISHAMLDFGRGCFAHGQAYVALSRLRTLEGLALINPMLKKDIIVSEEIDEFYDNGCRGIGLF